MAKKYHQKERERELWYRLKKKVQNKAKEIKKGKLSTPQKKYIKNLTCWLRRKAEKERAENRGSEKKCLVIVSKVLWGHMSPSSRRKMKMRLKNDNTPKELNSKIRQEIGLNISCDIQDNQTETELQENIKRFIIWDDVGQK